jgi:hypothetical protein
MKVLPYMVGTDDLGARFANLDVRGVKLGVKFANLENLVNLEDDKSISI